jgi:phosphate transport system permease protein
MNTLLIIIIAIGIGLPLSLMIAIYLNEFAKKGKVKKILLFFIDSLGATPTILFGMFGLIFFIQTMGMSAGGAAGKSILAGALTILIVILPVFIRTIQQALQSIPQELRTNSYALGVGKWETIRKIVLPAALQGITTAVILSIGRILAETAPLYLTSGLVSSSSISLINPGQTLTTRIYAQIYTADVHDGTSIMYECAFVTMVLVLLIILVIHVIIPAYYRFKQRRLDNHSKFMRQQQEKFDQVHLSLQKILTSNDV